MHSSVRWCCCRRFVAAGCSVTLRKWNVPLENQCAIGKRNVLQPGSIDVPMCALHALPPYSYPEDSAASSKVLPLDLLSQVLPSERPNVMPLQLGRSQTSKKVTRLYA